MLKILRVRGDSLEPEIHHGDFLLLAALPGWRGRLLPGDMVIFEQPAYGTLVKRVKWIDTTRKEAFVIGTAPGSVDSRIFGCVPFCAMRGRVVQIFYKK